MYQALWNAASVETPDTRLIRIGYGGLQSLCGLDKTNCKDNIQSLIRKLAVDVVSPFSVQRNQGNVYRIFSSNAILKRRKAAGMEWVIRNKGVRFVRSTYRRIAWPPRVAGGGSIPSVYQIDGRRKLVLVETHHPAATVSANAAFPGFAGFGTYGYL